MNFCKIIWKLFSYCGGMFFFPQQASFPRRDDTHNFTCIFTGLSFDNSAQATTALLRKGGGQGSLLLRTTEAVYPEEAAGTHMQVHAGEEEHRPPVPLRGTVLLACPSQEKAQLQAPGTQGFLKPTICSGRSLHSSARFSYLTPLCYKQPSDNWPQDVSHKGPVLGHAGDVWKPLVHNGTEHTLVSVVLRGITAHYPSWKMRFAEHRSSLNKFER